MKPKIQRQLRSIDWDFVNDDGGFASGLHWYPGTFVPSIPGALIEALSCEGDWVFDPYCGVGTTGIAATMRGRNAILTDINPIALTSAWAGMTLATLAIQDVRKLHLAFDILEGILDNLDGEASLVGLGKGHQSEIDDAMLPFCKLADLPKVVSFSGKQKPHEALEIWFDKSTLHWLGSFWELCGEQLDSSFMRVLAATMVSSVMRNMSSQTKSWGHIADNVKPKTLIEKQPSGAMRKWITKTKRRFEKVGRSSLVRKPGRFSIQYANWADPKFEVEIENYSLLVTSPPYAGAIDYTLAQRLSLYLFGWSERDLLPMVESEIGARRKRFKSLHVSNWAEKVAEAAKRHAEHGLPNSHAAYVFPHKDSGRAVGEELITSALEELGWSLEVTVDRSIRQSRTRHSWTSIKKETILIFGD